MIRVVGLETSLRDHMKVMIEASYEDNPEAASEILKVSQNIDTSAFIDQIIPLYAEHYTPEVVTAVADFYSTEIGRKFVESQPALVKATMPVSQAWMMEAFANAMDADQQTIH